METRKDILESRGIEVVYGEMPLQYTEETHDYLAELWDMIQKKHPSTLRFAKDCVKKFPKVPEFHNYLSVGYNLQGRTKKALETQKETIKKFPKYVFGRLACAVELAKDEDFEELDNLLGEDFGLKDIRQEPQGFIHQQNYRLYNFVQGCRELGKGDRAAAKEYLACLIELDEKHILTKELGLMILSSNKFGFGDENYEEVLPEFKATHKEESLGKIPVYKCSTTHIIFSKEIKKLTADDVLSLEKEDQDLLRADMHLALQDSMARFDEYQDREWDDYEMSFPYHALNILAFIGNRESLEIALNLLRQDEKFIDFWCADVADWYFDNILILLGKDNLDLLEGFLLEPYIFSYHKATISPVLAQIALNFPEKRDEVIQIFEKIYQTFKERKDDTTLFDTRFLSFLNCEIIHVKAEGLLHYVKWLSDNNWIDGMVTGNYEDIKTDCEHENTEKWRKELPVNIAEVYTEAHIQRGRERRSEYRQELESLEEQEQSPVNKFLMDLLFKDLKAFREEGLGKVEKEDPRSIPVRTEKKIGRNEPCPCGSGKKYKKCCLRK